MERESTNPRVTQPGVTQPAQPAPPARMQEPAPLAQAGPGPQLRSENSRRLRRSKMTAANLLTGVLTDAITDAEQERLELEAKLAKLKAEKGMRDAEKAEERRQKGAALLAKEQERLAAAEQKRNQHIQAINERLDPEEGVDTDERPVAAAPKPVPKPLVSHDEPARRRLPLAAIVVGILSIVGGVVAIMVLTATPELDRSQYARYTVDYHQVYAPPPEELALVMIPEDEPEVVVEETVVVTTRTRVRSRDRDRDRDRNRDRDRDRGSDSSASSDRSETGSSSGRGRPPVDIDLDGGAGLFDRGSE